MGGGTTPTTQTTTQQLSPEQQQMLQLAMPQLTKFANSTPTNQQTVVGFNPNQTAGQGQVLQGTGNQQDIVNSAGKASQFLTSGEALDPSSNPALANTIAAAVRPIQQNLTTSTLPQISGQADTTGNYGGSRQGIAQGLASGLASNAIGDTAAKVAESGYQTGMTAMTNALGLAPSTAQAQSIPGATTSSVGDIQQQQAQAEASAADTAVNYASWLPYIQGSSIAGLVGGIPGGSTTTVGSTPAPNKALAGLGGAASGAALGSSFGPVGTAAGAGLGGLLGLLSDRRYKHDIERIGTLFDGTPVYRYKKMNQFEIGIMAQDVEDKYPEAVHDIGGIKFVEIMPATERAAQLGKHVERTNG